jgi:hypothetical protein
MLFLITILIKIRSQSCTLEIVVVLNRAAPVGDHVRPPRAQTGRGSKPMCIYCTCIQLCIDTQGVRRLKMSSQSSGNVARRGVGSRVEKRWRHEAIAARDSQSEGPKFARGPLKF